MIALFVLHQQGDRQHCRCRTSLLSWPDEHPVQSRLRHSVGSPALRGCAVAAQRSGNTATDSPSYLRTAEVADILHVSPIGSLLIRAGCIGVAAGPGRVSMPSPSDSSKLFEPDQGCARRVVAGAGGCTGSMIGDRPLL
jgi:hypothetical protein